MALTSNSKVWKILTVIFIVLTIILSILVYFKDIFIVFVVGFVLILMTQELKQRYANRAKKRKYSEAKRKLYALGQVLFWSLAFLLIMSTQIGEITSLIAQGQDINLPETLEEYNGYIPEINGEKIITVETLETASRFVFSSFSEILQKVSFFIFNGFLIIPLMFYMYFKRKDEITATVYSSIPTKFHKGAVKAIKDITSNLDDFFRAKLKESIVVGAIAVLGFYIIGVKGWLFLGFIVGILNVVPYIGPIIGAIPAILIAWVDSPLIALLALITVIVAQLVDNFYLVPFMISSKVKMDSMLTIVLILIAAKLFGIFGMIFAIPIYIVYKVVLKESYDELVKMYPEK